MFGIIKKTQKESEVIDCIDSEDKYVNNVRKYVKNELRLQGDITIIADVLNGEEYLKKNKLKDGIYLFVNNRIISIFERKTVISHGYIYNSYVTTDDNILNFELVKMSVKRGQLSYTEDKLSKVEDDLYLNDEEKFLYDDNITLIMGKRSSGKTTHAINFLKQLELSGKDLNVNGILFTHCVLDETRYKNNTNIKTRITCSMDELETYVGQVIEIQKNQIETQTAKDFYVVFDDVIRMQELFSKDNKNKYQNIKEIIYNRATNKIKVLTITGEIYLTPAVISVFNEHIIFTNPGGFTSTKKIYDMIEVVEKCDGSFDLFRRHIDYCTQLNSHGAMVINQRNGIKYYLPPQFLTQNETPTIMNIP